MPDPDAERLVAPRELMDLLSPALGEQVAQQAVNQAFAALRLPLGGVSVAQAIQALEHVAQKPGLVGITGRFAISRVILTWGTG